jgi:hypothetical protein
VKLSATGFDASERAETLMRHAFVIAPLCDSASFGRKARLYYCNLCKWSFLVCESKVAALDGGGSPLNGDESSIRFSGDDVPCPVLETLALEALEEASAPRAMFPRTQIYARQTSVRLLTAQQIEKAK